MAAINRSASLRRRQGILRLGVLATAGVFAAVSGATSTTTGLLATVAFGVSLAAALASASFVGVPAVPVVAAGYLAGGWWAERTYEAPVGASGIDAITPIESASTILPALLAVMLVPIIARSVVRHRGRRGR